ncbi:nucleoside triphosphate pyrophosphohydrolase [Thalassobacter stenotrophicus]|nr:nucleoside triphosphate pyrophosphohydrolase [Thalassobacter stenotrophicus]
MHRTGGEAGPVGARFLLHRKGVHVRAQPNRRPLCLAVDDRDQPGLGNSLVHLIHPKFAQLLGHERGRLVAGKINLRVLVQPTPPFSHLRRKVSDGIEHGHGLSSLGFWDFIATVKHTRGPAMDSDTLCKTPGGGLPRLLEIMRRLRDPNTGCPWDIEQTFETIAPYTIEEAYEVADAIERGDMAELKGELGDLLLQVVYHGEIGAEAGHFDFDAVAEGVAQKMVDRHPHIFGDESRDKSAEQQVADWEAQKARERAAKARGGVLDDVALGLPALLRAVKLQKRAARVGFDWPETTQVLAKMQEEAAELVEAQDHLTADEVTEEMGDLLFVMANLARHMGVDPEAALRAANAKFVRRFGAIEASLAAEGRRPEDSDLAEMDALWDAAKRAEKTS